MWSQKGVWKLQEKRSLICTTCGGPRCSPVIHNEPKVPALCKWAVVDTGQWSPNEVFGAGGYRAVLPVRVTSLAQGIWAPVLLFLGGEQEVAQALSHA